MRRRLLAVTTAIAVLSTALLLSVGVMPGTGGGGIGCTGAKSVWCQPA